MLTSSTVENLELISEDRSKSWMSSIDRISEILSSFDAIENLDELFKNLDAFLEDPTILDPYISIWLPKLSSKLAYSLRCNDKKTLFKVLAVYNHFCKIRGSTSIRSHFPHDIETVRELLIQAPIIISQSEDWVIRTMMLLWASLAVLTPFRLENEVYSLESLVTLAKLKLSLSGKECTAAALFLSSMLRRPGQNEMGSGILEWSVEFCDNTGVLEMLISFLKAGSSLKDFTEVLYRVKSELKPTNSTLTKKLHIRFLSRLCVAFNDDEALLEDTLVMLLEALRDSDSKVRWSTAKGIGRICAFLDDESVLDIVRSLIGQTDNKPADLLQGCCLTIGQLLSSTKVEIPMSLSESLLSFVIFCLRFEVSKGTFAIGAHVRDSACYLCWAWCKYQEGLRRDTEVISKLSAQLISLALFDREINCRRAGSAAFQELVGRTSRVPHGIELMTKVDFFSVSSIQNCFGESFNFAVRLDEYRGCIIDHLVNISCKSFDKRIRTLAAKALGSLCLDEQQLSILINYAISPFNPVLAHAGLLTLSNLINSGTVTSVCDDIKASLLELACLENSRKPGYQLLAESWLTFTHAYISKLDVDPQMIMACMNVIKTALRSRFTNLHTDFCPPTLQSIGDKLPANDETLTSFYRTVVLPGADKDFDPNAQRGYSAVIGSIPTWLFQDRMQPLTSLLCRLASKKEPINDVEKRCLIIQSFGLLHGRTEIQIPLTISDQVYSCILEQLDDYSNDSRGDVGSFIRESSMVSCCKLLHLFNSEQSKGICAKILQQALDRLDRVRWTAIDLLNEHSWPITFPKLEKNSPIPIYQLVMDLKLLDDPIFRGPLLLGWISSAGSPVPSISDPAWSALSAHFESQLPHILESDVYWKHESRFFKSVLCTLQKWACDSLSEELAERVCQSVIKVMSSDKCAIHVLFEAVKLLKTLKCRTASKFIESTAISSPYPRIRQLCSE